MCLCICVWCVSSSFFNFLSSHLLFSVFKWFTFCVICALFFFLSLQLYLQHSTIQHSVRLFSMTLLKVEPTAIGLLCIFGCWCSLPKIFYHRNERLPLSVWNRRANGISLIVAQKFALHAIRGIKLYQQISSWYSTLDGIQRPPCKRSYKDIQNTHTQ